MIEINKIKCFSEEHKDLNCILFCQNCKIYMCSKCEVFHSKLFKMHKTINLNNENKEIFTGICAEKNHNAELEFFCKTHNKLCCVSCLCKIKKDGIGSHHDCDVCLIENIKDEKIHNLNKNIKSLEELKNTFEESIKTLKNLYEKINLNKESLKTQIQNIFTKIRNELNNREDILLLKIDEEFDNTYLKEEMIRESEELPKKIKLNLEKGKTLVKDTNNIELSLLINDCINIENNIKKISVINESIKKYNNSSNIKIEFFPEEEEVNNFLELIKNYGQIQINSNMFNINKFHFKILNNYGTSWKSVGGSLTQISSGFFGIFGFNLHNYIYYREGITHNNPYGSSWTQLSGLAKHISNGKYGVWVIGANDLVYFLNKASLQTPKGNNTWDEIGGKFKYICVGDYGVWAIDANNNIYFREEISELNPKGTKWTQIEGSLSYISVGYLGVWGVNSKNEVFLRSKINKTNPKGDNWLHIDGQLTKITVGKYGIFGLNENQEIFFRKGINNLNFQGTEWIKIDGNLKDIYSGEYGVWGINDKDEVFVRENINF